MKTYTAVATAFVQGDPAEEPYTMTLHVKAANPKHVEDRILEAASDLGVDDPEGPAVLAVFPGRLANLLPRSGQYWREVQQMQRDFQETLDEDAG